MNPFHEHLSDQVYDALRRGIAVVVDPAGAFAPFFEALVERGVRCEEHPSVPKVQLRGVEARFVRFEGSWFAVRATVEPFVAGDGLPETPVLVYVPAQLPDAMQDVLMEMEKAGRRLLWTFDTEARNCLRCKFTDGVIDEVLNDGRGTYEDVVAFLTQRGGEKASRLRVVFPNAADTDILVRWLADDSQDGAITAKGAGSELYRLVLSKVGLKLDGDLALAQARAKLARYVLINEFRYDLKGDPPGTLESQRAPEITAHRDEVLVLARRFRAEHPAVYVVRARQIEQEFHLARARVRPENLGRIDTFEFEERVLLRWCAELLESREYGAALAVITERENSFWVELTDQDSHMPRKEQWELCRRVAELGLRVAAIKGTVPADGVGPEVWVARYAAENGWHRSDAAQRALETWRSQVTDESVAEKAVGVVLREHERVVDVLATGFSKALARAGWVVPGILHQTRIYPDIVATRAGAVALFFVDAMRFEMGTELARQLDGVEDLHLLPAIAALPSITPVGMAALLPGASANFSVVEHKGKLASMVDGVLLANVTDRIKYLEARVPAVVDMTLSAALRYKPSDLKKKVSGRSVVVRSTEIDYLGETGDDHLARQAMEMVIGNLARAVRRLAAAGVEHFVITADHGHQFGLRKGEDMKIGAPTGNPVEVHRRCWIGRGPAIPIGTVRVTAASLGYASDLDFVFPTGLGVFKSGGDLSFHHGSTSLQELVIPVLSFRIPPKDVIATPDGVHVRLKGVPDAITNRMFVVNVETTLSAMFGPEHVEMRVVLMSEQEQVGMVGMASGVEFDRDRGILRAKPGTTAHVGLSLVNDNATSVKVVVLDPATGAVLASSLTIPNNLMR